MVTQVTITQGRQWYQGRYFQLMNDEVYKFGKESFIFHKGLQAAGGHSGSVAPARSQKQAL